MQQVELLYGDDWAATDIRLLASDKPTVDLANVTDAWPEIVRLQGEGYQAYIKPNRGGWRDAQITEVVAAAADFDDLAMPTSWHVPPAFIVARSPTRFQVWWLIDGCTPAQFKAIQLRLAAYYEARKVGPGKVDTKVCNPATLLRLAGTVNLKGDTPEPQSYALTDYTGGSPVRHSLEAFTAALPEVAALQTSRVTAACVELDLPANIARAREWLKRAPPAIEFEGGNDRTYRVAAEVRGLGVSEETAVEIMDEPGGWNERCEPPWGSSELAAIVGNAYRYAQNDAGAFAADGLAETAERMGLDVVKAADVLPQEVARAMCAPVPFRDVLAREVPPVAELIPGLVEKGVATFLSGPGGVHKSRLALQWGLCLDAGASIFGRPAHRATFVYLSCEDHADEVARRAQAITHRLSLPADGAGQFLDMMAEDATLAVVRENGECVPTPGLERLRSWLQSLPGHKFVVMDSTYNVLRFEGSAKINEGAVKAAIGLLQRLCEEADATIVMLWHPSQSGQDRGDASGWSVAWHNAPRARLSLSAVKEDGEAFTLKVEKRNHGPKGKPITLHWSGGALLPLGEVAEGEQEAALLASVVRVAIAAAEAGAPIQRGPRRLAKWQLDEIEGDIGRRPPHNEVKEALAAALPRKLLSYVTKSRHRSAGYYPPDLERAVELAHEAKHRPGEGAR